MLRVFSSLILFILFFVLPWWLTFIFAICLVLFFNFYAEAIILGFLFELIYGGKGVNFFGFTHFFLVFFLLLFLISFWLKKVLKFY